MVGKCTFCSEEEKKQLIRRGDRAFERQLAAVAKTCADGARVILLAGPSASGKTTTAARLRSLLEASGKRMEYISLDDYYLDREVNERRAALAGTPVDYESAAALDLDAFGRTMADFAATGEAECPVFRFAVGARIGTRRVAPGLDGVLLVEGIQTLYPEVERMLGWLDHRIVFIRPRGTLRLGDVSFDGDELRLLRRIVRNSRHRASTPVEELALWRTVRENEEKNIFPFVDRKRMQLVNSMFPFEVNILAPYLFRILREIPADSPYAAWRDSVLARLAAVEPIDRELLGVDSMFREFVF